MSWTGLLKTVDDGNSDKGTKKNSKNNFKKIKNKY